MKMRTEKQTDVADQPMISEAKAAEMCGMTREAIHNLVRRGRFHSVEAEGRALVSRREVEAFAAEKGR